MKLIVLPVIVLLATSSSCFNVDVKHPYVKEGPPNSLFGYTVDFHHEVGDNTYWLLTGAPSANSSNITSVDSSGAIFRCPIASNRNDCLEIPMYYPGKGSYAEVSKGMCLGVSLQSSHGIIVACGHKFSIEATSASVEPRMPGRCYVWSSNFSLMADVTPCIAMGPYYVRCMAGISIDFSKDGKLLNFGSIGVRSSTFQGLVSYFESTSKVQQSSDVTTMSYTDVLTNFGEFAYTDVIAGSPRDGDKIGMVHILSYSDSLRRLIMNTSLSGEQFGSYFGSETLSIDINNDGLEDLFVGAPFYSKQEAPDCGRVYLFMGTKSGIPKNTSTIIYGPETNFARFGFAISSIGDINLDGFPDIAVGAPGNEPKSSGAVYIYHGTATGVRPQYVQKILGKTIDSSLVGFGVSLSGGIDVDANNYPDIAVGVGYSDKAVILRSRPIMISKATVKVIPDHINFNDFNCIEEGQRATCVVVEICFQYGGVGVPNNQVFQYELSVLNSDNRIKLKNVDSNGIVKATSTVSRANNIHCLRQPAYAMVTKLRMMKREIREVFAPVNLRLGYSLLNPQQCELCPVIDSSIVTVQQTNVGFYVNIGGTRAVIGSTETLAINVRVRNVGEPAYLASVLITIPDFLPFIRVTETTANNITCEISGRDSGISTYKCSLNNPTTRNEEITFDFIVRSIYIPIDTTALDVVLSVSSASKDLNQDDNINRISIPVLYEADLSLSGYSSPLLVRYVSRSLNISEFTSLPLIGPTVTHIFRLENRGPGPVENFLLTVDWPVMYENVGYLMYLTSPPTISGADGSCTYTPNLIDPIGIRNRTRTSGRSLRNKRSTLSVNNRAYIPDATLLSCDSANIRCERITCTITGTRSIVDVTFVARLWQNTLNTIQKEGKFLLSSRGRLEPIGAKYLVQPGGKTENIAQADTQAMYDAPTIESAPVWIIVVSAMAGFFLLSGCVYILWKCGFFKRKKIEISGPIGAEENENQDGAELTTLTEEKEPTKVDLTDI
ncbi:uncharacterized protein TRIADDRAFT_54908 [Trichoplax adhaerens]|uniref:Integrin alpha-2 domain-containing protein n=1 Tax=Trichoplax adhaerens TaxID=10228 RepID=B3RTB9_TRIAD|nr:hypothetical protein TRIADDRAFT_54908 [Trichoplax adhaerens]EDV27201.1 hypothetical protein TRIADDRAFT_54908 [Trichoplax adhaerens]|eukprot:XP_002111197.1 hypothetical protein TRIADDRAFT_54908 [Trichoplax adhaerens]